MTRYTLVITACVFVVAVVFLLAPEAREKAASGDYGLAAVLVLLVVGTALGVLFTRKGP